MLLASASKGMTRHAALSPATGYRTVASAAAIVLCMLAAGPARSERWVELSVDRMARVEVELDSVSSLAGYSDNVGAWIRYTYPISVDCSPPRNCYAASQLVYTRVDCARQTTARVQHISMDRHGDVIAETGVNFNAPRQIARPDTPDGTIWRTLCPAYPEIYRAN